MAYNKAREEQKWKSWKEREEEKLRELGMDEASIQILHESDWADFNSERRLSGTPNTTAGLCGAVTGRNGG